MNKQTEQQTVVFHRTVSLSSIVFNIEVKHCLLGKYVYHNLSESVQRKNSRFVFEKNGFFAFRLPAETVAMICNFATVFTYT